MISLKELNQTIAADITTTALPTQQSLAVESALRRVVAEDIHCTIALPSADLSAMDGYAFIAGSQGIKAGTTLTLVGESIAGAPFSGSIEPGQCVRIMTGAVLPDRADSVEMQEYVSVDEQRITFNRDAKAQQNIRYRGEELSENETVLRRGQIIYPPDILLLAGIGRAQVPVYRPRKIALFSTGDELREPGTPLSKVGQIYDSNRAMLKALLADLPVTVIDYGLISDDPVQIKNVLCQAAAQCEVIITSGGVSVGDYDFLKAAVRELGEIRQYRINIKPGKPFVYGKIQQAWYFGLPGNPVSSFVGFTQIIAPALWQLAGAQAPPRLTMTVPLATMVQKRPGRQDFQRGLLTLNHGQWQVAAQGKQDSHRIYALARANCFIVLDAEDGDKNVGEYVNVVPFRDHFALGGY